MARVRHAASPPVTLATLPVAMDSANAPECGRDRHSKTEDNPPADAPSGELAGAREHSASVRLLAGYSSFLFLLDYYYSAV